MRKISLETRETEFRIGTENRGQFRLSPDYAWNQCEALDTMVEQQDSRTEAVRLFLAVAEGTVSEADFWPEMDRLFHELDDPVVALAREEAHHYWGNFHERNILLVRTKPKPALVAQGKELFRTLARALEEHWPEERLREAMKDS